MNKGGRPSGRQEERLYAAKSPKAIENLAGILETLDVSDQHLLDAAVTLRGLHSALVSTMIERNQAQDSAKKSADELFRLRNS